MPETTTSQLSFHCPAIVAEAVKEEANLRGVSVEELVSSLVVTPLSDQLAEIKLGRINQLP